MNKLTGPRSFLLLCWILAILILPITALSCTCKQQEPTTTPTPTSSPVALPLPTVTLVSPADNSVISAGNVTISVNTSNFNVAHNFSGYIHYYMDVAPPTTPFKPAFTAAGTYVATTDTSYTWTNVLPGTRTFSVQLTNTDNTPLMPLSVDTITVHVVTATENQ